jgi:GMP synthase (glutamine-hydrolysing)
MNRIAILDFGSQFAHLLANRIRRLGVYSEILDSDMPASALKDYKGIIVSGGPASVNAPGAPTMDPKILDLGIPLLGVCYGHQLILHLLGGVIEKGTVGEYGLTQFTVQKTTSILSKLEPKTYPVYASHFDTVTQLPKGFEAIGSTPDDRLSATANEARRIYTIQFHAEVTHSTCGIPILDAFIDITGAKREWSIEKFIEQELAAIHEKVGDKKVFLMISGGVDSSVAYVLLARALGADRIHALYVDTGFMRKNETQEIQKFLKEAGVQNLHVHDGGAEYFEALKGVYDPEQKRKIIGDKFIEIQRRVVHELQLNPDEWLFGQGTIYPDTIESGGTKNADRIKTHHNRVPEIEAMIQAGRVIEPLKELYKDEVRSVGEKLGLPAKMVRRHPFPGPGLAVRCLCLDKPFPAQDAAETEHIINDEWTGPDSLDPHVLPVKSVGVQGDERTYRHPLLIDPITHDWDAIRTLSPQLTNRFRSINRVLLKVAVKPAPNGSERAEQLSVTPGTLTPERIEKLQVADALVRPFLEEVDTEGLVWQCPVVLLPLSINTEGEETIVLRPVSSMEAMTANFTELPWDRVQYLAQQLLDIEGISGVLYDATNKPPATIEWE